MYVWLDALTNYLTAIGYPNMNESWPADVHVVGKDILRFHAVYWPAFLMAANLPCPKKIVAHGWWTNEGQKISKSLGNVIDPLALISEFGLDQTRYFLMREVPFGNDGNFSRDRMVTVINSELANTIGNLCQRTLGFIHKNCDGRIPGTQTLDKAEDTIFEAKKKSYFYAIENCHFNIALEGIHSLAVNGNQYIDEHAPWKLKKENPELMAEVLKDLTAGIRQIAILLQPFIPKSAAKMLYLVGYPEEQANKGIPFSELDKPLKPGTPLPAPIPVFPRIVEPAK